MAKKSISKMTTNEILAELTTKERELDEIENDISRLTVDRDVLQKEVNSLFEKTRNLEKELKEKEEKILASAREKLVQAEKKLAEANAKDSEAGAIRGTLQAELKETKTLQAAISRTSSLLEAEKTRVVEKINNLTALTKIIKDKLGEIS